MKKLITFAIAVTRKKAKEKLAAITVQDGFDETLNRDTLFTVYKDIGEMKPDEYLSNTIKCNIFWTKKIFSYLGGGMFHVFDPNNIFFNTAKANAYYIPTTNAIFIPLAIQSAPIYMKDQHPALTYGRLGYVLGHELTHGFDGKGSYFDKDGNEKVFCRLFQGLLQVHLLLTEVHCSAHISFLSLPFHSPQIITTNKKTSISRH